MAFTREWKLRALTRSIGQPEYIKGDEAVFFCPRPECINHHKPKLSINLITDRVHCWVCDFSSSNLLKMLRIKGKTHESEEYASSLGQSREIVQRLYDIPELPPEFISFNEGRATPYFIAAYNFLKSRGLDERDVVHYRLGYCEDGEYANRIIVPSFDKNGDLNFAVGRSFYETSKSKYKHGNFDKDIIFNEIHVNWKDPVILVEGPFDSFIAGDNSIPLQGSSIQEGSVLFKTIVEHKSTVYFALDSDALSKQLRIIEKFYRYGIDCHMVPMGKHKDPGSMTKDEFKRQLSSSIQMDPLTITKQRMLA